MLDFANETSGWFSILGKLSSFHRRAVLPLSREADYNWQASVVLLASLSRAVETEAVSQHMYDIFCELFLRTLAPYFNIASIWYSSYYIILFSKANWLIWNSSSQLFAKQWCMALLGTVYLRSFTYVDTRQGVCFLKGVH